MDTNNYAVIYELYSLINSGKAVEAQSKCIDLLSISPDDKNILTCLAIAQRYANNIKESFETLLKLETAHPNYSRYYQELGHHFVLTKNAPRAIESFERAIQLNNALPACWSMLIGLYKMVGDHYKQQRAEQILNALKALPEPVVTASALLNDGEIGEAERIIKQYLLRVENDIDAMRLLARIAKINRVYEDSELLLTSILALDPNNHVARMDYAELLVEMHRHSDAIEQLNSLNDNRHNDVLAHQRLLAAAYVGLGDHVKALELYRDLLSKDPADASLYLAMAHTLKTVGRTPEAIVNYRRAAEIKPAFGDAYWSLANLKTYQFTESEISQMLSFLQNTTISQTDRAHLYFALGKAFEDTHDYSRAMEYFDQGNIIQRRNSDYSAEIIESNTKNQKLHINQLFFSRRKTWGYPVPDPIFIVGLPRSGSTLIEQILASHSQVEGTQELPIIQHIVAKLRGNNPDPINPIYPRVLIDLSADEVRDLGKQYIASAAKYRFGKDGSPVALFIDKMPNNFRHIGLIKLILPNAKVIDARRDPFACCIGNLKQLFARGQEFSYSVDDIARYYLTYIDLMDHWNQVLPEQILRVDHADTVDNLEATVRRILSFCGLEFEANCLEFHQTSRSVRTASSEQVRQPIYREGLEQWKNYDSWVSQLSAYFPQQPTSKV